MNKNRGFTLKTLGKNARQHVEKHFSERLVQQQTLALYLGTDPNPTL